MTKESRTTRKKSIKFMLRASIILIVALVVFYFVTVMVSDSSDSDTTDEVDDDTAAVEEIQEEIKTSHNDVDGVALYNEILSTSYFY